MVGQLAGAQRGERRHQAAQVLAGAQIADREQVRRPVRDRRVADGQRGRIGHHAHRVRVGAIALDEVGGDEGRPAQRQLCGVRRPRDEGAPAPRRPRGELGRIGLEGEVVHADHARAGAAQGQQAAGGVDQVGAVARQAPRPAHLLPQHLRSQPAHVLADRIDAEAFERRDQLARVAPGPPGPRGAGLARVDRDGRRHAARRRRASPAARASAAWTTATTTPRTTAVPSVRGAASVSVAASHATGESTGARS